MKGRVLMSFGAGLLLAAGIARGQAQGPYQFYGLAPCRIVDTRNPSGPVGGPSLTGNSTRNFPIVGYCNVPSTAKAVTLNVTVVGPTASGYVAIYPVGTPSTTSNINFPAIPNSIANAVVTLLAAGTNNVTAQYASNGPGTANLLIDVSGYFQ